MTALPDYISAIRPIIRDQNSSAYVFQDADLTVHINSAVRTYSRYRRRKSPFTLNLVPGQSKYTLPADWISVDLNSFNASVYPSHNEIKLSDFASFVLPNLNSSISLQDSTFDWYDSDQYMIMTPTPEFTSSFTFDYYIAHTIDANSSTVPDMDFDFICYLASAHALRALAADKGSQMQKYKIGQGLTIDDSKVAEHLLATADKYEGIFQFNIIKRPYGVSG